MRRFLVVLFGLLMMVGVVSPIPVEAQAPDPVSETFEFNSTVDHGDYEHCTVTVSPSPDDPSVLVPSDETCFKTPEEARSLAENGPTNARAIFNGGLIAVHWSGPNFTGTSLSISGTDCAGGGITFTGGAWDDRISSTENGCSLIEHWENSAPFSFTGLKENTTGTGGTLTYMDNKTSGVLYKGAPVCAGLSLEECYAPEIRFHPAEQYYPMDPTDFVEGSELIWANDQNCADTPIDKSPTVGQLAELIYEGYEKKGGAFFEPAWDWCDPVDNDWVFRTNEYTRPYGGDSGNGERATRSDDVTPLGNGDGYFLEWTSGTGIKGTRPTQTARPPLFVTEYTSLLGGVEPGERWLVYQVFYGKDPKSVNFGDGILAHQGDWERVDVVLNSSDSPVSVQYHGHGCSPIVVPWENAAFSEPGSTHPVAYVAEGTHASYPTTFDAPGINPAGPQPNPLCNADPSDPLDNLKGQTDATAAGGTVWQTWLGPILAPANQCWYQFGGAWGATNGTPGISSNATGPNGPPWKMIGDAKSGPGRSCYRAVGPRVAKRTAPTAAQWSQQYGFDVSEANPGTSILAYVASLPTPLGSFPVDANGNATVDVTIPQSTPPGIHRLVLADASTGEEILIKQISIDGTAECLSEPAPGVADDDGDYVINDCDQNPFDGPLADADFDLVPNENDNCPLVPNPGQEHFGERTVGTACDPRQDVNIVPTIIPPEEYPLPPTTTNDEETVEAGEETDIDVLDNDTDPEDDLDEQSLRIETLPTLGMATIVIDDGEPEISYTAGNVGGGDTIGYVVCDDTERCARGTLTITVIAANQCTVTGTTGDDNLIGTDGDDIICARGGNDIVDGRGGNDIIFGGPGADTIDGGDGADQLFGGRGDDTIRGQDGNDLIRGGRGNDTLRGNGGDDTIRGGNGADQIDGGNGADTLYAGKGQDILDGGAGADTLYGRRGADSLGGGAGNDTIYGGRGPDTINGNQGDDTMYGRRGNDTLNGGGGTDTADGGRGNDSCNAETVNACE